MPGGKLPGDPPSPSSSSRNLASWPAPFRVERMIPETENRFLIGLAPSLAYLKFHTPNDDPLYQLHC